MKAIYIVSLIAVLASARMTNAQTKSDFVCKTVKVIEKKVQTEVRFTVSNLNDAPAMESDSGTEDGPIAMKPKDSLLDLNDNWTFEVKGGKLTITSDGDGCQWTTFVLYEDSAFKKGYVQVKGSSGCGSGDYYSKVTCKITSR